MLCKKLWMLCYARNYVHQSVIRRFETLDVVLCRNICYEIVARKYELKHDEYKYQVFLTCNNMLRKIGRAFLLCFIFNFFLFFASITSLVFSFSSSNFDSSFFEDLI